MKLIKENSNSFPLRKKNSKKLFSKFVNEHKFEITELNSTEILATTNLWSCTGLIMISKFKISLFHIVNLNDLNSSLQKLIQLHSENNDTIIEILIVNKEDDSVISKIKDIFTCQIIHHNGFSPSMGFDVIIDVTNRQIKVYDMGSINNRQGTEWIYQY